MTPLGFLIVTVAPHPPPFSSPRAGFKNHLFVVRLRVSSGSSAGKLLLLMTPPHSQTHLTSAVIKPQLEPTMVTHVALSVGYSTASMFHHTTQWETQILNKRFLRLWEG
ncbi:hypothetical protein ILYODFUR_017490 [Ilyodon furcidens]|uniref:Uncharacterized protein n=1 Tax=Ilyodon furcidens TaxID=33524 RepID=A0ABV0TVX3_9TELE